MKTITLLLAISCLLCGCSRNSELDAARENLAEAQRKIAALENERVPRVQYDVTRASLRLADERIATLEQQLKATQEQLSTVAKAETPAASANQSGNNSPETPLALGLAKGGYALANETYVYSADAQLNFGNHLQISSPTGLLVTDPDLRVVGGDLSIKSKGMTMETTDGLLTTESDGSVKFTGNTLTMKFAASTTDTAAPEKAPAVSEEAPQAAPGDTTSTAPAPSQ